VGSRRVLILVVAVALAAVTAFATYSYASSADERANKGAQLVDAFVVKKDIIKGFPGERALDEGYIGKDRIPRKYYPAKAVVDAQTLRGKVALAPMAAGLPVVDGAFVEPRVASESFAQRIDKGMQAITISVDDVRGVARLVVPGDHVNMMLTTNDKDSTQTQYMLQNLEILAVGNSTMLQPGEQAQPNQPAQAGVVQTSASGLITFAVPAQDAAKIALASRVGEIYLTLVPPDFAPAPVPPVNRGNLFS
jgi:pilus assembly protein CpaB